MRQMLSIGIIMEATTQQINEANTNAMLSLIAELRERMDAEFTRLHAALSEQRQHQEAQLSRINNNVRRYGGTIQSAFANQIRTQTEGRDGVGNSQQHLSPLVGVYTGMTIDPKACLLPRPKDLTELWMEYSHGIAGRKAARLFTLSERNDRKNKQKFYNRMNVWKTQARLIDGGMNVYAANQRIVEITGSKSITGIIRKLVEFKKTYKDNGGVHPQLKNAC